MDICDQQRHPKSFGQMGHFFSMEFAKQTAQNVSVPTFWPGSHFLRMVVVSSHVVILVR